MEVENITWILEQAIERCGTKQGNRGFSAMQTAIEMVNVLKGI